MKISYEKAGMAESRKENIPFRSQNSPECFCGDAHVLITCPEHGFAGELVLMGCAGWRQQPTAASGHCPGTARQAIAEREEQTAEGLLGRGRCRGKTSGSARGASWRRVGEGFRLVAASSVVKSRKG